MTTATQMASKHVPAGAGRILNVMGDRIEIKLTGEDTDGASMLFENASLPGRGVPTHIHRREDETFYILEGEVEAQVADETVIAGTGTTIFLPRDVPHSWRVVGSAPARFLVTVTPAGFEHYFAEMDRLPVDESPDLERIFSISKRYGIEFMPPTN